MFKISAKLFTDYMVWYRIFLAIGIVNHNWAELINLLDDTYDIPYQNCSKVTSYLANHIVVDNKLKLHYDDLWKYNYYTYENKYGHRFYIQNIDDCKYTVFWFEEN